VNPIKQIGLFGGNFLGAPLSKYLVIAPNCLAQHDDLEVGVVVVEFGGGDCVQAFSLGLPDQVLRISRFVIVGNDLVGCSFQVGAEHPVGVSILLKEFPLKGWRRRRTLFLGNTHRHKAAGEFPPKGLIHTAIVLDRVASPGLVRGSRVKRGLGPFVGDDELEAGFSGYKNAFATEKLLISSQKNLLNTPWQMVFDLSDEDSTFLPVQDVSFPEFAQKILSGFIYKTQDRAICLVPSMAGVVSHAAPLLVAINRFRSGIHTRWILGYFRGHSCQARSRRALLSLRMDLA